MLSGVEGSYWLEIRRGLENDYGELTAPYNLQFWRSLIGCLISGGLLVVSSFDYFLKGCDWPCYQA